MCEHSHTSSAQRVSRRARTSGRPNVAQHESWRPFVQTRAYRPSSCSQPAANPWPAASDAVALTTSCRSAIFRRDATASRTPGRGAIDVHEHEAVPVELLVPRHVAANGDQPDPLALHRLSPDPRGVRTQLAVDDGIPPPRSVDLDEQPGRHLRRRRRDRLVALACCFGAHRSAPPAQPGVTTPSAARRCTDDEPGRVIEAHVQSAERERLVAAQDGVEQVSGLRRHRQRPVAEAELDAIAGRRQPQQRPRRHDEPGVQPDRRRVQGPESGRRLASPHLLGHPPSQRQRVEVRDERLQAGPATDVDGDRLAAGRRRRPPRRPRGAPPAARSGR